MNYNHAEHRSPYGDETVYTCFDPPTYSVLRNPKDDDKPSKELLNDPNYIAYCESVLGCRITHKSKKLSKSRL